MMQRDRTVSIKTGGFDTHQGAGIESISCHRAKWRGVGRQGIGIELPVPCGIDRNFAHQKTPFPDATSYQSESM